MARRRRQLGDHDTFGGVSLADVLTTALGCVLLLFLVAVSHIRDSLFAEQDAHSQTQKELLATNERKGALASALESTDQQRSAAERALSAARARAGELEAQLTALRSEHDALLGQHDALRGSVRAVVEDLDPRTARPVDVMLVIDGTRSMKPSLDSTRRNLESATEALRVVSPTARVGVVVFRDKNEKKALRLQSHALTADAPALRAFLGGIQATSTRVDRDRPEWLCGGIAHAVEADWRPDAIKLVIAVSDAGAQDPGARRCLEDAQGFREAGGRLHMLTTRPRGMRRKAVRLDFEKNVLPQHRRIAAAGGGLHVEQADADDLLTALLRAAYEERARPLERLKHLP